MLGSEQAFEVHAGNTKGYLQLTLEEGNLLPWQYVKTGKQSYRKIIHVDRRTMYEV